MAQWDSCHAWMEFSKQQECISVFFSDSAAFFFQALFHHFLTDIPRVVCKIAPPYSAESCLVHWCVHLRFIIHYGQLWFGKIGKMPSGSIFFARPYSRTFVCFSCLFYILIDFNKDVFFELKKLLWNVVLLFF